MIADAVAALRIVGGTVELVPVENIAIEGPRQADEYARMVTLTQTRKPDVLTYLTATCTRCHRIPVPAGRLYGDHDLPTANYCYPCLQAVAAARYPHTPGKANPNETKVRHTLTPVMERQLDLR